MRALRKVVVPALYCLLSIALLAEDKKPPLLDRVAQYQTVIKSICDLLAGYKGIDEKEAFQRRVDDLVASKLHTVLVQEEFAILSFHLSQMDSREDDYAAAGFAFEEAFVEMLRLLAKDKSKESTEAFIRIHRAVQLDGGLGLDFKRYQKEQVEPKSKER